MKQPVMKNILYILISFSLLLLSCNSDEDKSSKEEETQNLTTTYDEIITMSMVNTTPCTNSQEWAFTPIGSKACGGPVLFIPYSLKINVSEFLKKVDKYTTAQNEYNKKWGIISTCDVPLSPSSVDCVDGKPTLIYSDHFQKE
jgi:hypothetical protein